MIKAGEAGVESVRLRLAFISFLCVWGGGQGYGLYCSPFPDTTGKGVGERVSSTNHILALPHTHRETK